MAIPSTGTDWDTGGFADVDNRFLIRGGRQAVLIRQAQGSSTDMSPTVFSPFALDGLLRDDLFIERRESGFWVTVSDDNQGFRLLGAFKEGNGPSEEPKLDKDDFMIEQSNRPFDTDIVKEDAVIKVTPVETLRPFIKRLRNNLPLVDENGTNLVEDPGQSNSFWGTPIDTDFVEWQLLLLQARKKQGKTICVAKGYPLCKLIDKGASKMDKKDSDASEFSFQPVPDGFMVDLLGRPIVYGEWVAGDGWTALGGVPVLSATPPVATATTSGKATIAFTDPTGTGDPWVITAQSTADDGVTWVDAPLDNPGAVTSASGTTTVKVKTVATGSKKFRAVVVGSNGATANTPKSNAVTIT